MHARASVLKLKQAQIVRALHRARCDHGCNTRVEDVHGLLDAVTSDAEVPNVPYIRDCCLLLQQSVPGGEVAAAQDYACYRSGAL